MKTPGTAEAARRSRAPHGKVNRLLLPILAMLLFCGPVQAQVISLAVSAGAGNSSTIYNTQDTYRPFASMLGKALEAKVEAKPLLASSIKSSINGSQYPLLLVYTSDAAEALRSKRYEAIGFSQDLGNNHIYFFARADSSAKRLADVGGRCVVASDPFAIATGDLYRCDHRDATRRGRRTAMGRLATSHPPGLDRPFPPSRRWAVDGSAMQDEVVATVR